MRRCYRQRTWPCPAIVASSHCVCSQTAPLSCVFSSSQVRGLELRLTAVVLGLVATSEFRQIWAACEGANLVG
jgi:hypothetical protein